MSLEIGTLLERARLCVHFRSLWGQNWIFSVILFFVLTCMKFMVARGHCMLQLFRIFPCNVQWFQVVPSGWYWLWIPHISSFTSLFKTTCLIGQFLGSWCSLLGQLDWWPYKSLSLISVNGCFAAYVLGTYSSGHEVVRRITAGCLEHALPCRGLFGLLGSLSKFIVLKLLQKMSCHFYF